MRHLTFLLFVAVSSAQVKPANPGFEQGELGSVPIGWFVPSTVAQLGFGAKLVEVGCRTGRCAEITPATHPPEGRFGNLMQNLSADGYQLRRIRLRAAIRVEGTQTRAQMWLRIDRADHTSAFLENMGRNPITSSEWKTYDIEADVPEEASGIAIGFMLFGPGRAWVDDVSLDITGEIIKEKAEPARPLGTQELANLSAFARLYGYVRFFHPSDQAAATDWETFAIEGVRRMEEPSSAAELVEALKKIFHPIAPTVEVYGSGKRPTAVPISAGPEILRYKHTGVGLRTANGVFTPYRSVRARTPA